MRLTFFSFSIEVLVCLHYLRRKLPRFRQRMCWEYAIIIRFFLFIHEQTLLIFSVLILGSGKNCNFCNQF